MPEAFQVDVALFGGGIAGLWTLNRLRREGFSAVLLERDALGARQTLASQGMIHGGQKYRAEDVKSSIAAMPAVWDACIEGRGPVDLTGTRTLAPHQVMWSATRHVGNLVSFLASKFTRGDTVELASRDEWPEPLRQGFNGTVYRLNERVVDVKSVIEALGRAGGVHQAEIADVALRGDRIEHVELAGGVRLRAGRYVFCAGEGNEEIARRLGLGDRVTQRRPLKQILVRGVPSALYGHCVGLDRNRPTVTVTSHPVAGGTVWYLGGRVAEDGATMTDVEAVLNARDVMGKLFPSIDWSRCECSAYAIDRAEPYASRSLPPGPHAVEKGNAIVAWPTKMTLAPALAERILAMLPREPRGPAVALPLPAARVGLYPWERALSWMHA